jgi:hypothetical protein
VKKPKGNVAVAKSGEERQQKPVEVLVLDGDVRQRRLKNAAGRRKALKMRRSVKKASPLTPTGWWKRPQEVGSRFVGSDAADVVFDLVAARLEGTNPIVSATNKPTPTDQAIVMEGVQAVELELELELIQTQMATKDNAAGISVRACVACESKRKDSRDVVGAKSKRRGHL